MLLNKASLLGIFLIINFVFLGNSLYAQKKEINGSAKRQNPNSTVGVSLSALKSDPQGNIWVAGSVWFVQGLLLKNSGNTLAGITPSKIRIPTDICFPGNKSVWIVADGNLFKTNQRVSRLKQAPIGNEKDHFVTVFFSSPQHGWAAGWNGTIFHTQDGGTTWERQQSNTQTSIEEIHFVDKLNGWFYGKLENYEVKPIIGYTDNGGKNWQPISLMAVDDLVFVDKRNGWAVTQEGICQTTDSGRTWSTQYQDTTGKVESLFFLNKKEGWAVGRAVFHTTDGGRTWIEITDDNFNLILKKAVFLNSGTGQAIAMNSQGDFLLVYTKDSGKHWEIFSNRWKTTVADRIYREKYGAKPQ